MTFVKRWRRQVDREVQEPRLVDVEALNSDVLRQLAEKRIGALRISGFVSPEYCRQLTENLRHFPGKTYYDIAPRVGKIGTAFFETQGSEKARAAYHENHHAHRRLLTEASRGLPPPVDLLMEHLQRRLPEGVIAESVDDRPLSAGIFRLLEAGAEMRPHQDMLALDAPDAVGPRRMRGQIATNLYLEVPESGGELLYWKTSLSPEAYERQKMEGTADLDRNTLPLNPAKVAARRGDLILINSNCVHAVRRVNRGLRITSGAFLGYYGPGQPWTIWS